MNKRAHSIVKAPYCVGLTLFFVTGSLAISFGQGIVLSQSNESGIYQKGEKIRVSLFLDRLETDSLSIRILKNFVEEIRNQNVPYLGGEMELFNGTINEPVSLVFEVSATEESASMGLVVDPGHFEPGTARPRNFDQFWQAEKEALRALPMEVKAAPVKGLEVGYLCSDLEINCTGPKPARGYFAKPGSAQPKSLPIVLYVHAAGVAGSWCLAQPETALRYAKMGQGALSLDLNAHGMLNGQPQGYYDSLQLGELRGYFYQGAESRDEFYFRGMYLRLMRALDFLTSQPEWDGQRILVIGESQGGGQALVAAGLDHRVTAVVATVPAMCDWGGPLVGRTGGWPNPLGTPNNQEKMLATLPYFDAAHILKNSPATLMTEIGFIDRTCPPASIYAALNQADGKKVIYGVPYRGHHLDQKVYQETWEKTVYQPKMEFIEEFLK